MSDTPPLDPPAGTSSSQNASDSAVGPSSGFDSAALTASGGAYQVLARKYRPSNFDDLIGQEPMVQTLTNAFESGRIAQAYMLTGVRGVGKTTTARILARALNYQTETLDVPTLDIATPGIHCHSIMEGSHPDVIEMDAASHTGIGDIREIIAAVRYKPVSARYKVYVIDEVHMLSTQAFNGLLKTLEEPPPHVKFIFATTEIRKVPITVLSRCQRFDLRRIDAAEMTTFLGKIADAEAITVDDSAKAMIARASEGSVRDALSLLDQAIAHAAGSGLAQVQGEGVRAMLGLADRARVIDLFEHVMKGDIAAALIELKAQYDVGADPATVLTDLAQFVHFVTRLRYVETALNDPSLSEDEKTRGKDFAERLNPRVLGRAWQMLLKGIQEVQLASRPLAAADMVLVRLTHASDLPTPDEVIKQITSGTLSVPSAVSNPASNGGAGGGNGAGSGPSGLSPSSGEAASGFATQPDLVAPTDGPAGDRTTATAPSSGTAGFDPTGERVLQRVGNGPALVVDNQPMAELEAATPVPAEIAVARPKPELRSVQPQIHSLQDLLKLAEQKRDLKFKLMLRNNFSEIAFENGRIEFAAVGNAPRDMQRILQDTLLAWTGEAWEIVRSELEGQATLKAQAE
ncbi:MAG: DNA polymerase III subunit gamma/tau, partial [Pseudomonadota bacterium]